MGQLAAAVLVGIIPDKKLAKRIDSEDGNPVYEELPYSKHPERGEDYDCIGFAAVLSNGGEDDEGEFRASALLSDFGSKYKKDVARARKKWDAFATWMKDKKGIELPEPTLLLALVERA